MRNPMDKCETTPPNAKTPSNPYNIFKKEESLKALSNASFPEICTVATPLTINHLLRPNVLLILIRRPHPLDDLLPSLLRHAPLLRNNRAHYIVDITCHIRRIAAHVEISLLFEEFVDFFRAFLEAVLDVDFLRSFAGEGGDEFERGAEFFGPFL